METWRLLDTGARSAAENMALDEVLLELKAEERIPHTLRFLQFSNPSVLVGHHQSVEEEVRLDYCQDKRNRDQSEAYRRRRILLGKARIGLGDLYLQKRSSDPFKD